MRNLKKVSKSRKRSQQVAGEIFYDPPFMMITLIWRSAYIQHGKTT